MAKRTIIHYEGKGWRQKAERLSSYKGWNISKYTYYSTGGKLKRIDYAAHNYKDNKEIWAKSLDELKRKINRAGSR